MRLLVPLSEVGKFNVVVIDPPWPIKKIPRKYRPNQISSLDYPVMSISDIEKLPIREICENKCFVFLWTIQRFLPISFEILKNWGAEYQLTLCWDKQNGMCMRGFHMRNEFVIVGLIGKTERLFPRGKAFPTVFSESSWRKHSVKPSIFYEYAQALGNKRIDVFARQIRPGWAAWGNEIEGGFADAKDIL